MEDDTEVKVAEAEMDEVDTALRQSRRKYDVRRKHSGGRSRLGKMLSNYKMKLDFRCNCTRMVQQAVLYPVYTIQPVVKRRCTTGLTTGCIHDTTGCQTGCQTCIV